MRILDACLESASILKQAVHLLNSVGPRCWMQVTKEGLLFGVRHHHQRVPVELCLLSEGFFFYTLRNQHLRQNQNQIVEFDLLDLYKVLNIYYDDHDVVMFSIPDSWDKISFWVVMGFGEDGQESPMRVSHVTQPYFSLAAFYRMERPFTYKIDSIWLRETLLDSIIHEQPLTITESNTTVEANCGVLGSVIIDKGYFEETPNGKIVRFQLCLHTRLYFYHAMGYTDWIYLHTQDPSVDPNVPPSMSFPLNPYSRVTFYMPFNSMVEPKVEILTTQDIVSQEPPSTSVLL